MKARALVQWLDGLDLERITMYAALLALLLVQRPAPFFQPAETFPPVSEFRLAWYTKHLDAMAETPLSADHEESYRFLWLRTFHRPIAVRVDCTADLCSLRTKRLSGAGGYEPGTLEIDQSRQIPRKRLETFLARLEDAEFWQSPPATRRGFDGAQWILEGRRGNDYHVWDQLSPEPSGRAGRFRKACLELIDLSGLRLERGTIY